MVARRIIPCLDIKDGRTVKGINFLQLKDAGDPVELAKMYSEQGADELVFLDITATTDRRKTVIELVKKVGREITIPFTVGGGIADIDTVYEVLAEGADKVSINSAAIHNPKLIEDIAYRFGSQCVVVAIDAKKINEQWIVHTHGGRRSTDLTLFDWAKEVTDRGCGELLFTSMDHDGTKKGFAEEALAALSEVVTVPVIASGGAGSMHHFSSLFKNTSATGALAASIFHYGDIAIPQLKSYLKKEKIDIRL